MAATVDVYEWNGTSGAQVATKKTNPTANIWFRKNDSAATDNANPLTKPSSTTDRSMEKWLRLRASGTFTSISTPTFYTDGSSWGTGINVYARTSSPGTTYATPSIPANDTGGTDVTGLLVGGPKTIGSGASGSGDFGDFLVLWMTIGTTVTQGVVATKSLSFGWSEI
jgi:hypothetical protein